jgi:hypothetical protein
VSRASAAVALAEYSKRVGSHEQHEPLHWQASDLITDLLLSFDPATANDVLHRVHRDLDADRTDTPPLFPPAD